MLAKPGSLRPFPGGTKSATCSSEFRVPTKNPGRSSADPVLPGQGRFMKRYIVYRLLQGVVLLCLVATIVFFLGRLTGNPVDLMLPEDATPADRVAMIKALGPAGPLL